MYPPDGRTHTSRMSRTRAAVGTRVGRLRGAGGCWCRDHWLQPGVGRPSDRRRGNDAFADCGLPVRSPLDGVVRLAADTLGGTTVYVTQGAATYVYMAHLS